MSAATKPSNNVVLGFGNEDEYLDVVFANFAVENSERLGDGGINFACDWVSEDIFQTMGLAVGEVRKQMIFTDGFETGNTSAWSVAMP